MMNESNTLNARHASYMPTVELAKAVNGFDAGLRITKFKPDVILLDYVMPGIA